jgi:hypothetical protein
MITAALRKMETAPTICAGITFAFGVMIWVSLLGGSPLIPLGAAAPCAVGWWAGCRRMRKVFDDRAGWQRILLEFHIAVLIPLATGTVSFVVIRLVEQSGSGLPSAWGFLLLFFNGSGFVMAVVLAWVSRQRIEALQRETAVRLAHEILRRHAERLWR